MSLEAREQRQKEFDHAFLKLGESRICEILGCKPMTVKIWRVKNTNRTIPAKKLEKLMACIEPQ